MTHTVSGKLFKAPFVKSGCGKDGQSTMFAFKLSEKTKDFKSGQDVYANYDAVIYAQSQAQVEYYTNATAEGSFVVVSCDKLQPKISDCGKYVNIDMNNARLDNANFSQTGNQQQAPQQSAPQQAPQKPMYAPAPMSENDKLWVESIRANPSSANQITDANERARILALV